MRTQTPYTSYSSHDICRMIEHSPQAFQDSWRHAMYVGDMNDPRIFSQMFFMTALACATDPLRNHSRVFDADIRSSIKNFLLQQLPLCVRGLQSSGQSPSVKDLTQIISAFDMLAVFPNQRWQSYLLQGYSRVMPNLDGYAALKIVRTLRTLAVYPGDQMVSELWDKACEQLDKTGDKSVDEYLYSLAIFDYLRTTEGKEHSPSPIRDIVMTLLEIHQDHFDDFFPDGKLSQQVFDAALWFNHEISDRGVTDATRDYKVGKSEITYRREFAAAGVRCDDYRIERMHHGIDILLDFQSASAPVCLFEVDGKYHFNGDMDRRSVHYNGMTMFRTALIERELEGQNVVLLRAPDYALREFNLVSFKSIVRNIASCVPKMDAGAYVMHGPDQYVPVDKKEAWVVPTLIREEIFKPV